MLPAVSAAICVGGKRGDLSGGELSDVGRVERRDLGRGERFDLVAFIAAICVASKADNVSVRQHRNLRAGEGGDLAVLKAPTWVALNVPIAVADSEATCVVVIAAIWFSARADIAGGERANLARGHGRDLRRRHVAELSGVERGDLDAGQRLQTCVAVSAAIWSREVANVGDGEGLHLPGREHRDLVGREFADVRGRERRDLRVLERLDLRRVERGDLRFDRAESAVAVSDRICVALRARPAFRSARRRCRR